MVGTCIKLEAMKYKDCPCLVSPEVKEKALMFP